MSAASRTALALVALVASSSLAASYSSTQAGPPGFYFLNGLGCSTDAGSNLKPDNAAGCLDDLDSTPAGHDRDGDGVAGESPDDCLTSVANPVSEVDAGTDCDGLERYATGTVKASLGGGFGGPLRLSVGNDRDDDGAITDLDADGSADQDCSVYNSVLTIGEPGCYDDEFSSATGTVGPSSSVTVSACFTLDRLAAGLDWDRFRVDAVPTGAFIGTIVVQASFTSTTTPCIRSGHNDSTFNS